MPQMHFSIPGVDWSAPVAADTPTYIANTAGYLVASVGGALVPYGVEHLVGKMGGLWFHPIRACAGWQISAEGVACNAADECSVGVATVTRTYRHPRGRVVVREQMDPAAAALHIDITLQPAHGQDFAQLSVTIHGGIDGCWFGGMDIGRTESRVAASGAVVRSTTGTSVAGGVAIATAPPAQWDTTQSDIVAHWQNPPDRIRLVIAGDRDSLPLQLAEQLVATGVRAVASPPVPHVDTGDPALDESWRVAQHNIGQLVARYPDMPQYALAGIPEYPQFFGCDTTYSIPGLLAAGAADVARTALDGLAVRARAACGRVPHEITTNGRVYHPGNAQETPQFAVACWQYLCWTGDRVAAQDWYAVCVEGMEHVAGVLAGRHWPYGDGMVERHGMGPFKLDSVCSIAQALAALAPWAAALGYADDAQRWRDARGALLARFEAEWWLPDAGLYADSLLSDGSPRLDRHWTAVVPVQTQTATAPRSAVVYQTVKATLTNEWGLVHTGGVEDSVWTLPTGLLALAAFGQGDTAYGVTLLQNIAGTARHGSLGLLKELIPQGLCFVQLWSAGLLCQGIVEGLAGIAPDLMHDRVAITPKLPAGWPPVVLHDLRLGGHRVHITIDQSTQRIVVTHHQGAGHLEWEIAGQRYTSHAGAVVHANGPLTGATI